MSKDAFTIRLATPADIDFLFAVDQEDEGYSDAPWQRMTEAERNERLRFVATFAEHQQNGALVVEEGAGRKVGALMWRTRSVWEPGFADDCVFGVLDSKQFPPDGLFCEIFQLWVDPSVRRQGIATRLKVALEDQMRRHGVRVIYTHTEEDNLHVLAMNQKLGYFEVRRGPIWDETIRVSLMKQLT